MKILVCGGREYTDRSRVATVLQKCLDRYKTITIIHGDARGADRLARDWAIDNSIDQIAFPADWDKHKKAAGPIRNQQMLDEGKPDLVIAFPGNTGTADMIRRSRKTKIPVVEIDK
jgi:cysteine synthase